MQEIHSMGGGGRFFGGGGAGDRRLRPHSHHQQNNHQALKCPRCDSLNTKFCYYNNYNLSQPRHFCKNCRRYWTKGGVLRNVPVGGGCRKSKRGSNNTNKTPKTTTSAETAPRTTTSRQPEHNSNSHSSSESSSLTAAATATVTELNSDSSNNNKLNEPKSLLIHQNPSSNPNLDSGNALEQGAGDCGGIFSEIGTFTSLIASSSANNDALAFGFGGVGVVPDATSFQWQHQQHQKIPDGLSGVGGGGNLLDHGHGAVTVDLSALQGKNGHGGFGPLDWQGGSGADHQGLFDLPNAVDQAYWSHTQWSDQDNSSLFHLP